MKPNMKVYELFLLNLLMKQELIVFINTNMKVKLNYFSDNKLKLQPRP